MQQGWDEARSICLWDPWPSPSPFHAPSAVSRARKENYNNNNSSPWLQGVKPWLRGSVAPWLILPDVRPSFQTPTIPQTQGMTSSQRKPNLASNLVCSRSPVLASVQHPPLRVKDKSRTRGAQPVLHGSAPSTCPSPAGEEARGGGPGVALNGDASVALFLGIRVDKSWAPAELGQEEGATAADDVLPGT